MSESGPICLSPANRKPKLLSVGFPVAETEIQIVDLETGTKILPVNEAGEIRARGPQFTKGYRNRPEETTELIRDGWLYTGDIGYVDEEDYVFLIDRKKEMVIVGGYNVYPRQVDEILINHPKIVEAATIGKPHHRLGEVIVAFVVLKNGEQMTEEAFFEYCQDSMVKYKRPVEVTFMDALPRTGAKKIDKRTLKKSLTA
jgi:long-chain acyl-CoA synthetase